MIDRLSGDFNRGYTKAIQDTMMVFKYLSADLRFHKIKWNQSRVEEVLDLILKNRESIRENCPGFIRYNSRKKGFEWYVHSD